MRAQPGLIGASGAPRTDVLLVDDDRLVLEMMSDALGHAGYPATTFRDPQAALRALQTERPAVIVSDYMMPSMDGVSFLTMARERMPEATRVLCTASNDFDVALGAVNSGAVYRIVRKPWREKELIDTVADAADRAALRADDERAASELNHRNGRLLELNGRLEKIALDRTENLLDGLVAALDCRDSMTQWHSRRVSRYALRLAAQLGVADTELAVIEQGALLHDIGKIGVRDEVLRKRGALTAQEWDEMRKHAALGYSLLQRMQYLRPAATIVLQHHERWDGSGYPARLAGEDIAVGARVFHVVDALDAITSDRPYRKARPLAAARDEIERLAGTHFDPRMVEAFLDIDGAEWEQIRVDVEMAAIVSDEPAARGSAPGVPVLDLGERPAATRPQWARKRLGELLLDLGLIDRQQLASALDYQRWHGCKLGVALIEMGFASEDEILTTVALKLGYDRVRLDSLQRTPAVEAALRLVPTDIANQKGVVPVACDRSTLTVALRDPTDLTLVDELAFRSGRRVRVLVAGEAEVRRAVARLYSRHGGALDLDVGRVRNDETRLGPLADAI